LKGIDVFDGITKIRMIFVGIKYLKLGVIAELQFSYSGASVTAGKWMIHGRSYE